MQTPRTGEVFNAAARDYGAAASLLWNPLGEAYVERVGPATGDHVLDACCGMGASAVPAARAVGAAGRVDAVDLAAGLVEGGRRQAAAEGLTQLRFHTADVTAWSAPGPYDLVLCGYGIFFLSDMDASARKLAALLRPGGRFSVATWAKGSLEDFGTLLHRSAAAERSGESADPLAVGRASARTNTEGALEEWATGLGLDGVSVHRIVWQVELSPGDAWNLVVGTGFRAMLHHLDEAAVERGRDRFLNALADEGIDLLDATSLVAVGSV